MGKKKKIIELDDEIWQILEKEAKADNRSLKNYVENYFENLARQLAEPSDEYKAMMDDLLDRQEKGTLKTIPIDEIRKRYGILRNTADRSGSRVEKS